MPPKLYGLDPELKQVVQQVCRQFLNSFQPRPKHGRRSHNIPQSKKDAGDALVGQATGTIPGRTFTGERVRPGIGSIAWYEARPAGVPGAPDVVELWLMGEEKCLNLAKQAVPLGAWIMVKRDRSGVYWVDWEECPDDE